ncbi:MAG: DUF4168 domain-containing protein [Cyclobacteriaceae bacterium]
MKTDFSDEELKNFISVNEEVVKVQQEAEQEMMQVIDSEDGITVERFNEIAQAQQNPDMEVNIGDEEMMAFRNAAQKVMDVQRETEAEVAEVVEEEGMAFEDYRQIMMAYQQDPELQQRIQSMIQENPN